MPRSQRQNFNTHRRKLLSCLGVAFVIAASLFAFSLGSAPLEGDVTLTWYGQSMFTLKVADGPTILMDPFDPQYYGIRYHASPLGGIDVVTVSHEHGDHNYVALATGNPRVLRGLTEDLGCAKVDQIIKLVRFYTVCTCHVDVNPCPANRHNAVFVVEANGLRIAHVGDLGQIPTPTQVAVIGPIDVLLIPVGGGTTIDAAMAAEVVNLLDPKVIIPMHYRTQGLYWGIKPVDPFLSGKTVEHVATRSLVLNAVKLPDTPTVFVLRYE